MWYQWQLIQTRMKVSCVLCQNGGQLLVPNGWHQRHAQLACDHWVLDEPSWPKMVVICDLLGTMYAPVSKIPSVKVSRLATMCRKYYIAYAMYANMHNFALRSDFFLPPHIQRNIPNRIHATFQKGFMHRPDCAFCFLKTQIPFKNFSVTFASNGSLIVW